METFRYTDKLLKHDTQPCESGEIDEHDDTPLVAPDALFSAVMLLGAIVCVAVLGLWLLLT